MIRKDIYLTEKQIKQLEREKKTTGLSVANLRLELIRFVLSPRTSPLALKRMLEAGVAGR